MLKKGAIQVRPPSFSQTGLSAKTSSSSAQAPRKSRTRRRVIQQAELVLRQAQQVGEDEEEDGEQEDQVGGVLPVAQDEVEEQQQQPGNAEQDEQRAQPQGGRDLAQVACQGRQYGVADEEEGVKAQRAERAAFNVRFHKND